MCGILGDIDSSFTFSRFEQALGQLNHRGPFGKGICPLPGGALGMTRLPMSSAADVLLPVSVANASVAYNGEIYGEQMNIHSEVNTLLSGIAQRQLPDGMYAAAIWQPEASSLTLVRDRFGIKPLYYHYHAGSGRLSFASELRALLTLVGASRIDADALAEMIATGVTFDQRTLFSGIRMLAPGEVLRFRLSEDGAQLTSQTHPAFDSDVKWNLEEALETSIRACVDTFRPGALLLSGGVDSTLLNTWLAPDMPRFTLALHGAKEDVSDWPGLTRIQMDERDFMPLLRRSVGNYGSPTRMSSLLMYQCMADAVGDAGFHCVLVGEGADELFHGYPRHLSLNQRAGSLTPPAFNEYWFGNYVEKSQLLAPDRAAALCDDLESRAAGALADGVENAIERYDRLYSLEPLLRRADHLLMSRTIEARLPYLHAGIPQLAQQGIRVLEGETKVALRELLHTRMPSWRTRPKKHFRLPFSQWPDVVAKMRRDLKQNCEALRCSGLVNLTPAKIETMEDAQLFTLTTLSVWQQEYKVTL